MNWLSAETLIALATLTFLEIVLGVDNIIFISILAGKLPPDRQVRARRVGLLLAMGTRILLLFSLSWVVRLTAPLVTLWTHEISGRDLILIIGGLFLLYKATHEIHGRVEGEKDHAVAARAVSFGAVLVQIALLDIVFSLDSVITAVGMVDQVSVMVVAVVISVLIMMVAAGPISDFVHRHPTVKVLALSFLILIGVMLVADSFDKHIPKGYIYFAMAFSLGVEMLNLRLRKQRKPVLLRQGYVRSSPPPAPGAST
jgi:predicted tellurium resistance membrane protein TerC